MFETRLLRCKEYILTLNFVFQYTLYHGHLGAFMCSLSTQSNLVVTFEQKWWKIPFLSFDLTFLFNIIKFLYDRKIFYQCFIFIYEHFEYNVVENIGKYIRDVVICSKKYCVFLKKPLCKKVLNFISQIKSSQMQILFSFLNISVLPHCAL